MLEDLKEEEKNENEDQYQDDGHSSFNLHVVGERGRREEFSPQDQDQDLDQDDGNCRRENMRRKTRRMGMTDEEQYSLQSSTGSGSGPG